MSRPKWSLHQPITADQTLILVRQVWRIDDEILYAFYQGPVAEFHPTSTWSWTTQTSTPIAGIPAHHEWHVIRGRRGTVAAEHAAGAEIEYLEMDVF
jgi:hypothetical protein